MAAPRLNHWLEKIADELRGGEDEVPAGFKTSIELAQEMGWSRTKTRGVLNAGIASGGVELRRLRRLVNGKMHCVPYYGQSTPKH
jgi:DNA-binding FadR family transcriptional regulator